MIEFDKNSVIGLSVIFVGVIVVMLNVNNVFFVRVSIFGMCYLVICWFM